jgi:hypothetical protein
MRRIGIAAVLLAVLLGAVVFSPQGGLSETLWMGTLHNFAHGPIFGCVALLLLFGLRSHARFAGQSLVRQYLIVFALTALLGLATEIAQRFTGRDSSIEDLVTDMLGAASVLLLFAALDPGRKVRARNSAMLVVPGLIALGVLCWPLVLTARAYIDRARAFPAIADFTQGVGLRFISARHASIEVVPVPTQWAVSQGERALRVSLGGGDWPGIELWEPSPDWTGYRHLAIELFNPHAFELDLSMRIDDRHHNYQMDDRYNARIELPPQARTTIRIPLAEIESAPRGRKFDLERTARLLLFRREATRNETFYLVRVSLE